MNRTIIYVVSLLICWALASKAVLSAPTTVRSTPRQAAAIQVTLVSADRVAELVRRLYPTATIHVEKSTNSIVILASPQDIGNIRTIVAALDVRNPQAPQTDIIPVTQGTASRLASRLRSLFPRSRIAIQQNRMLIVTAPSVDLAQMHSIISALDAPMPTPTPTAPYPTSAFSVSQAAPRDVAKSIVRALPRSRASVAGDTVIVQAPPEDLQQVKALIEQFDRPRPQSPYVEIYRLASVDAGSVADLLSRSFSRLAFAVSKNVNAISVSATAAEQARIADAIAHLDVAPPSVAAGGSAAMISAPQNEFDILSLHAVVPSSGAGGSSTASDIAQAVMQAVGASAPDLKITVQPNSTRLILSGSEQSRALAKTLIAQLDVAEPLVELDTRVLEVDEGAQTQLGLKFPSPVLSSTYSETTPATAASGTAPQLLRLQPLTRTPLTLEAQLDFLVANNEAKILEDPRITTFSGRTATLRAGETVNILTTAGGGTGTVATTQVQSFQTGVTLDITPVVNADNYITVTLHPSVNSIAGIGTSGVPNIQTRDTTTTIGLHDGETLVVGGLIEDTDTKTVQKIPLLGDIPLIGRLFQDVGTSHSRNELVVTVTPHILKAGDTGSVSHLSSALSATSPSLPKISATATLPPDAGRGTLVPQPVQSSVAVHRLSDSPTVEPTVSPVPLPSAFAQANTFVYGAAPMDNFASDDQPPQIFYVEVRPTVVKDGTSVSISALTSTNVKSLSLGTPAMPDLTKIASVGNGKWQSTFLFDTNPFPGISGNVSEALVAQNKNGVSTTILVPFTVAP